MTRLRIKIDVWHYLDSVPTRKAECCSNCTAHYFYHTLVIVLKYGETHILLMSIVLLYFKREQLDFCLGQVVLTTQLLFSTGRIS